MAKIPMTILRPQNFRGAPVTTGDRIETENRKVAAVLTKLKRALEIPEVDLAEPLVTLNPQQVANVVVLTKELLEASKDNQVAPAKRAYKKRAFKRRGPTERK